MGERGTAPLLETTRGNQDATAARLVPNFCVTVAFSREDWDASAKFHCHI